jgi:pimeloyl-ACP methyl ester carboxylesterase
MARAAGDDVELVTFDGAGHFELVDPAAAVVAEVFADPE